jgi:hypothetical protein
MSTLGIINSFGNSVAVPEIELRKIAVYVFLRAMYV